LPAALLLKKKPLLKKQKPIQSPLLKPLLLKLKLQKHKLLPILLLLHLQTPQSLLKLLTKKHTTNILQSRFIRLFLLPEQKVLLYASP
jgi:hypothetical protein